MLFLFDYNFYNFIFNSLQHPERYVTVLQNYFFLLCFRFPRCQWAQQAEREGDLQTESIKQDCFTMYKAMLCCHLLSGGTDITFDYQTTCTSLEYISHIDSHSHLGYKTSFFLKLPPMQTSSFGTKFQ